MFSWLWIFNISYGTAILVAVIVVLAISYDNPFCTTPLRMYLIGDIAYFTVFIAFSIYMAIRGNRISTMNMSDPTSYM